ncbi:MAG: 1-phosphofructokinase family hexose kinase [Candidatus Sericytochromatia bacterium]|nr:1-phosphofructokinase family hexose kinase [Candidatus Tanganyikabacteria bacterium]
MILAVCANTSLDRTAVIPGFAAGKLHRVGRVHVQAGGKGVNVARCLNALGLPVLTVGFAGGEMGRWIAQAMRREGLSADLIQIAGESRSCFAILDTRGLKVTEVDEEGPEVSLAEVGKLTALLARHAPRARMAVLSGSLPPGCPPDTYRRWVEVARKAGATPVVDAAGPALNEALAARPYLVKPNEAEAEELLGYRLDNNTAISRALDFLAAKADVVALTLGARGAAIAAGDRRWRVNPPAIKAINTVGCGDAFLAGFVAGLVRNLPLEAASRLAVAAGSANATAVGAGTVPAQTIDKLEAEVRLTAL